MSNLKRANDLLNELEFENDFGEEPILLGKITTDKAVIGVGSIALAFAAWAIAQAPLAIVVGLIAWNDLVSLGEGRTKTKKTPPVIDTQAEAVYDEEEYEYEDEEPVRASRQEERRASSESKQEAHPAEETVDKPTEWTFYGDRQPAGDEDMPRRPRTTKNKTESSFTPQLPQVTNRAKRELIDRLKEECPGMLRLVKSHPLRMVGKQRTGKSTMAKLVCLLRMALIQDHRVIASTPHYEPANPYPSVFKTVGITPTGHRDYEAIYREWRGLAGRVHACRINSNTTVWDEFGLFDQVMPEDEIKSVLTSCLRETMKFGEYPIFIVHGETAAFLPGSKGLVTVFLSGTVRVETIGELIEDEDGLETIRPTGRFHITWLDGSQEEGQIPIWLNEKYLLDLLGNPVVDHSEPEPEDEGSRLQEPLKTIYQFAKKQNEWVTVREIQRKDFAVLKGKGAKNIRQYLGLLADAKLGEIDEEGRSDSAVSFLAK